MNRTECGKAKGQEAACRLEMQNSADPFLLELQKTTEESADAISRELYVMFANLGRWHLQKEATASISGEEGLLHYLAYKKNGVSSGFLKEQLDVGSGRMADILKRLKEKELISRRDDPKDSRKVIVYITEQGREHAVRTNERLYVWYRKLQAYLGEHDSRELVRILRRLGSFEEERSAGKEA